MRSQNDWAGLEKAEREGREAPGTVARLRAEEAGLPLPIVDQDSADLVRLQKLAELLNSDKATKARLKQLADAAGTAFAASTKASADVAGAAKLIAETARQIAKERADHEARIVAERLEHETTMKRGLGVLAAKDAQLEQKAATLADKEARLKAKATELRQSLESAA